MPTEHETQQPDDRESGDDRRSEVDPSQNPTPSSPPPDEEAVQKGEEILERIKPY